MNGGTEEPIQMCDGKNGNENILSDHAAPHHGVTQRARPGPELKLLIEAAKRDQQTSHNAVTFC